MFLRLLSWPLPSSLLQISHEQPPINDGGLSKTKTNNNIIIIWYE